jgi:putative peptidoglycan lipid II flippase
MGSVREVARLMGPRLLGVAVVQLNFWINTRLASRFVEGSVSGIVLAFTLMMMPQAAIAQSIAIAALPTFSAQYALGKLDEMRTALANSLKGALLLSMPASLGLILLRQSLVTLLYQRGAFDENSTRLVAWALLWYAAGLVGHAIVEILSRAFYSLHDTKTPVFVGVVAMSLNVGFSYLFSAIFLEIGWLPHGGLALANTFATALEAGGLILLMRNRLGSLEGQNIISSVLPGMVAAILMSMGLWVWLVWTKDLPAWFVGVGGILLGCAIYFVAGLFLGIKEFRLGIMVLLRRFWLIG